MVLAAGRAAFRRELLQKATRAGSPVACLFEITPACNLRCQFCFVALDPYRGPYLSTEQLCAAFDRIADAGVLYLTLTGGEIFGRRDFPEIYRHARGRGLLVTLFTNATMVTDRIRDLLMDEPPYAIEASIYGADAERYEQVTGIRGSYGRFERGIATLQSIGVEMLMKHPITSLTEDHLPAIRDWCATRGLPLRFTTDIENRHDGGQQPSVYRIEPRRVNEVKDELHVARTGKPREMPMPECVEGEDDAASADRLYRCGAGRSFFFVDALGNASHCIWDREPSFPLLEMEWEELNAAMQGWVNQPLPADAPCSGCSLRGGCSNCPARARLATGSAFSKDPYQCATTHAAYGIAPPEVADPVRAERPLSACAR